MLAEVFLFTGPLAKAQKTKPEAKCLILAERTQEETWPVKDQHVLFLFPFAGPPEAAPKGRVHSFSFGTSDLSHVEFRDFSFLACDSSSRSSS